jgi:hypothetical protein
MERQTLVDVLNRHHASTGLRAWRHVLHCLAEMGRLYGPFRQPLCTPDRVCTDNNLFFICILLLCFIFLGTAQIVSQYILNLVQ